MFETPVRKEKDGLRRRACVAVDTFDKVGENEVDVAPLFVVQAVDHLVVHVVGPEWSLARVPSDLGDRHRLHALDDDRVRSRGLQQGRSGDS